MRKFKCHEIGNLGGSNPWGSFQRKAATAQEAPETLWFQVLLGVTVAAEVAFSILVATH